LFLLGHLRSSTCSRHLRSAFFPACSVSIAAQ
jgi:hypothetical protein